MKNKRKPKKNQGIHWKTKENLRKTKEFIEKAYKDCAFQLFWWFIIENAYKNCAFSACLMIFEWKSFKKLSFSSFLNDFLMKKLKQTVLFQLFNDFEWKTLKNCVFPAFFLMIFEWKICWFLMSHQFDDFLGYWNFIEILMNFRIPPEPPQAERPRRMDGNLMHQGVQ